MGNHAESGARDDQVGVCAKAGLAERHDGILHHQIEHGQQPLQLGNVVYLDVPLVQVVPALAHVAQAEPDRVADGAGPSLAQVHCGTICRARLRLGKLIDGRRLGPVRLQQR